MYYAIKFNDYYLAKNNNISKDIYDAKLYKKQDVAIEIAEKALYDKVCLPGFPFKYARSYQIVKIKVEEVE